MRARFDYRRASPAQKAFHMDDESKFLLFSGGFGSGKTHGLCKKLLKLSWLNKPYPGGLMAPSYKDMKRDVLPELEEILDRARIKHYQINKADMFVRFPWSRGKMYLFTAQEKLRGPNLAYFGINEATLIEHKRFKEAVGRVRLKRARCPQIVLNGTPEGLSNFCYNEFIEKPMAGSRIIYSKTSDNAHNLSDDFLTNMEASFDNKSLLAYRDGEWVNMVANQFYYAYNPSFNEDTTLQRIPNLTTHVAMDFNVEHMTASMWHFTGDKLLGFDEIVLKENADTGKMAQALLARGFFPHNTIIYPDPAGKARTTKGRPDVVILREAGFSEIRVKNAAPQFRARQLNVNNLLEKQQLRINPSTMKTVRKDFMAVSQDPVTLEKIKKDASLTHASDGVDYMCDILFPFSGRRPEGTIERFR